MVVHKEKIRLRIQDEVLTILTKYSSSKMLKIRILGEKSLQNQRKKRVIIMIEMNVKLLTKIIKGPN